MPAGGHRCKASLTRPLALKTQFRANRHPAASADMATGLRADLIEDVAKPGEEENNKVRRRELLSFFTG